MKVISVLEFRAQLSKYLRRVRAGESLVLTEEGQSIAVIKPVNVPPDFDWAHQLVIEGRAHWNGCKPPAVVNPVSLKGSMRASSVILKDRR